MFLMDAGNIHFTNSKTNPIRPWFSRMVNQLELNAYNAGFNWNDVEMNISMSFNVWECVYRIYAYNSYYDVNELINKNVYFTVYTDHVRERQEEYLNQCALPIWGRMYPVILDNEVSDIHFVTCVSGQVNEEFSGYIKNINCYFS